MSEECRGTRRGSAGQNRQTENAAGGGSRQALDRSRMRMPYTAMNPNFPQRREY